MRDFFKKHGKHIGFIMLGVLLLDLGYYFFFSPMGIVCGGATGISIIVKPFLDSINMPQSVFLYIIEIFCLITGLILLGKEFFFKTILASIMAPTYVFILEQLVAQDVIVKSMQNPLLISTICGGVLSGVGIGICLKNHGSTGGIDVVQKSMSKYLHIPYSYTMYLTDWVIVAISGIMFTNGFEYNFEIVFWGIVGSAIVAYLIDMITLNARSRRTAYIITSKPDVVKEHIYTNIGRGCTTSAVKGGYTEEDKTMLICVMNKSESYKLGETIKEVDPEAFTFYTSTREVLGEYENRPSKSRKEA